MLKVSRLTKRYHHRAVVDEVSFCVGRGEVLGYLGPNGSGKSTTVRMLTGLLEPTCGQAWYGGRNIREDLVAFKRVLGYVPEEPYLYPYLTGREYLQLTGRLRGLPEKSLNEKIEALLNLFSLFEYRFSPIASYSKGMKQKVLITAALLHDPEVLIFDEPLSGLDVTTALIFRNLIHSLAREGKVILYSSHVLEVVEKVCTRVLILRQGKVVANDSVEHLRRLLESPSLEDVFAQLVVQEDTVKIAEEMVAVMKG
ncbi:MAG TPA: ABC transporter ATP-binding protein [Bryobacteraceae bacterium]|nr:ABC transporter ATP-binding protein [Bryobacteraceae bacterium]